jgi:hypothetical protein
LLYLNDKPTYEINSNSTDLALSRYESSCKVNDKKDPHKKKRMSITAPIMRDEAQQKIRNTVVSKYHSLSDQSAPGDASTGDEETLAGAAERRRRAQPPGSAKGRQCRAAREVAAVPGEGEVDSRFRCGGSSSSA